MERFIDRIRERRENRRFNRDINNAYSEFGNNNGYIRFSPEAIQYHRNAWDESPEKFQEVVNDFKFKLNHPLSKRVKSAMNPDSNSIKNKIVESKIIRDYANGVLSDMKNIESPISKSEFDRNNKEYIKQVLFDREEEAKWNNIAQKLSNGRFKTMDDVREFQKSKGLEQDGKLGVKTLAALGITNNKNPVNNDLKNENARVKRFVPNNNSDNKSLNNENKPKTPVKRFSNNDTITSNIELSSIDAFPENRDLNNDYIESVNRARELANMSAEEVRNRQYSIGNNRGQIGDNPNFYSQQFGEIKQLVSNLIKNFINGSNGQYIPNTGAIRFASGGSMNNQEFIKYLAECTGATDSQSLKKAMEALGEKGINALKEMFNKGVPASEVKKRISGQSKYMKKGGCLSCEGKMARFAKASKPELKKIVARANVNTISTLKCGGKAKKKMIKKSK